MKYEEYLMHFNPNHDKLGRFAKSSSGTQRLMNKANKKWYNANAKATQAYDKERKYIDDVEHLFKGKGMPFWVLEEKRRLFDKKLREQVRKDFKVNDDELIEKIISETPMRGGMSRPSKVDFLQSLTQPKDDVFELLPLTYEAVKGKKRGIAKTRTRDLTSQIQSGHNHLIELQNQQIMQQQLHNQTVQQAVIDGNRCMSLAMTGGMNPFMFG